MTAEEAFERAKEMIAEAIEAGATELLGFPEELEALPEEIGQAKALRWLYLDDTNVADLSPIAGMDWLTRLNANRTPVADLAPLVGLTGLERLWLNDTPVSDLSALSGASGLQELWLDNTPVSDLSALSGAAGLQVLSLNDTPVSDLSALSGAAGLRVLWLNNTQVSDLSALSGAAGLRVLSLDDTQVSDLSALSGAAGLQVLSLSNTPVSDLSALSGAAGLQMLWLNDTQVSDLSALRGAAGLFVLRLEGTPVGDLRPIAHLSFEEPQDGGRVWVPGIWFAGSRVTELDPELKRLSEVKDDAARLAETLAYLRGLEDWPPDQGGVPDEAPAGVRVALTDAGALTLADGGLDAGDPEQEDLHIECREKAARLVESFGQTNEYADLLTVAERYRRIIARSPEEIGPRVLWSVGNTLRVALQAHEAAETAGRLAEVLPPKVVGALTDLLQTHGLFQMGHPGMQEVLDAIREAARGSEASPVQEATLDAAEALASDGAHAEEELREVVGTLVAAARAGGSAARMALGALRDTVFNAMRAFGLAAYKVSTEGLKAVFGYDVIQWLLGQQTLLERYWVAIAGEVPGWFVALMVRLVHIVASLS